MTIPRMERCLEIAKPICVEIPRPKKHVSLIVRKNHIVSIGTNNSRTHPRAKEHGYLFDEVHSELDALLRYKGPRDGLTLVNFRFNRLGDMRISRPCKLCLPWCSVVFDTIWHSTNEGMVKYQ